MELRLLEYCVLAYRRYRCPIYSIVVYLREGGSIASTPFIITSPYGEEVLRFHFHTILLWDIPYRELIDKASPGLLPLVPLARGGADRDVIEEVIALLMPLGETVKKELLALMLLFTSLAFENLEDQKWIRRKFEMLKDILQGKPAYQYI
jgi:hypothetical protein